ncbi:hypothetical protein [Yinghuangia soli]|uniref:Leucine rich repeat variant n=1 Tax=Yinghuangia soli TaxID=2908204 RepID=A0AA41Q012_9ACTN|nr:hypothetical protein [Yinghuangia soli]MCF2529045.1 hypothetical protein [Yinghuangia soli]
MDLPTLPPELREEVLHGVARNAAAPVAVLRRLMRAPWAVRTLAWEHPCMTEELAAELLALDDNSMTEALACNQSLPIAYRRRLTAHPSEQVRRAAVHESRHHDADAPCDLAAELAVLADDPSAFVRAAVAEHYDAPDTVRAKLLVDPDPGVRRALALGWWTPPAHVLRTLLTDPDPEVRSAALAMHGTPPADLHDALLAHPLTRADTAPHVALTPALAAELARDPDEHVRAAVVRNPGLPPRLRAELEAERNCPVRYAVLCSPYTGHDDRIRLYDELCAAVDADDEIWRYTESYLSSAWLSGSLAWLARSPVADRVAALDSPLDFLRCGVAMNTADLPPGAFARVLHDRAPEVQRVAALYAESIRPEELERIVAAHGDMDLAKFTEGIQTRPDFPADAYPRLAASENEMVRARAAGRDLPAALLESLIADPEPFVREAAAANPGLPAHRLPGLLTGEPTPFIAVAVGMSPNLPVDWMTALLAAEGL